MRLKKLKRLLSLTLSAAMVASTLSVPVRAEGITDQPVPVLEDTADELEDMSADEVTDETEDSEVPDVEEAEETEDEEEVADDEEVAGEDEAEAPVVNAPAVESGDVAPVAEGTETPGTPETPAADAIVVGGEDAKTLAAAIAEAKAGTVKDIELAGDVTLGAGTYDLTGLTIDTKGFMITIAEATEVTLTGGTIKNEVLATEDWAQNHTSANVRLMFHVAGTLNINGGTYTTKGTSILSVSGTAVIDGNATFTADVTEEEIANRGYYDGSALINVSSASAKFVMRSGTIDADRGNKTGAQNCGMYGVFVNKGGEVELGMEGQNGPTIKSMFATVGMNYHVSPGRVIINSGTYNSSASCTDANEVQYNGVLYLPSTASVIINGGTFESKSATGAAGNVISIPYSKPQDGATSVRLYLDINGGTFKAAGTGKVLSGNGVTDSATKVKVRVKGGFFSDQIDSKFIADGFASYPVEGGYQVLTESVASVGGVSYTSLKNAVEAAKAESVSDRTVVLGKDIVLEESLDLSNEGGDVSINTQGHMITIPEGAKVTLTGGASTNITNNEVVAKDANKDWTTLTPSERRTILSVEEGGELTLNGGTYQSKGVYLLYTAGVVTAENAKFECTAGDNDISALDYYDGASAVVVEGESSKLTMLSGSIEAVVGNSGKDSGMYGIYIKKGAELELGTEAAGPTVKSMFAAVSMNGLTSPGTITINNGTYESSVDCAGDDVKHNAVIYLPSASNVTINGGTFTAKGTTNARHLISVPYDVVPGSNGSKSKVNLVINGGTFQAEGSAVADDAIFYDAGMADGALNRIILRAGTFKMDPTKYAGCREIDDSTAGTWVVTNVPNHTFKWVSQKDSTCWDEGIIGHYECPKCHEMAVDKAGATILNAKDATIPKKEHAGVTGITIPQKDATCTKPGSAGGVQCPNCKLCYETQTALDSDTDGTSGKAITEAPFYIAPTGHTYGTAEFTWGDFFEPANFKGKDFKPGEANGVTAVRTCSVCNAADEEGKPIEGHTQEATVVVNVKEETQTEPEPSPDQPGTTSEGQVAPWEGKGCNDAFNVTFTATATFEGDDNPATEDKEVNVTATKHNFAEGQIVFNWTNFDALNFVAGEANGVTATAGKCTKCDATVPATSVAVACDDTYDKDNFLCDTTLSFTATATYGEGNLAISVPSASVERTGEHGLVSVQGYQAPTCTKVGHWGYYQCTATTCKKYYYGEDSASEDNYIGKEEGLQPEDVTEEKLAELTEIDRIAHAFVLYECKWKGSSNDDATAIFRCVNCKNKVTVEDKQGDTKENITVGTGNVEGNPTCGQIVTKKYPVTVKFDKLAVETVVTEEAGKEVVTLTYNKNKETAGITDYEYELTSTQEQSHVFRPEDVTVDWADENPKTVTTADGDIEYYDTTKGIKVTMYCEGCGGNVVYTDKDGILDESSMDNILVAIVPIIDTEKTKLATCQADGYVAYDVKVRFDNFDGSGWQDADFGEAGLPKIETATEKDPDAHNWKDVKWENWKQVQEQNGTDGQGQPIMQTKMIEVTGDDGKTYKVPCYEVIGERECQNDGCTVKQTAKGEAGTEPEDETGTYIEIKVAHTEKTCTVSGRTTYDATFYDAGKIAKDPSPQYIYNESAEGHKFKVEWTWTADSENLDAITKYTGVSVKRYCEKCEDFTPMTYEVKFTDEYCTNKDAAEGADKIYVSKQEDGTFDQPDTNPNTETGRGLQVVISGKEPSCNEGGQVKYTANVKFNAENIITNEEKEIKRDKMGHLFKWNLVWTEDANAEDLANRYTLVAEKSCIRGDVPATGDNVKEIEVAYTHADPTCVLPGSDTWKPAEDDPNWIAIKDDSEFNPANKVEQKIELPVVPDNHNYQVVGDVKWEVSQSKEAEDEGKTIVHAVLTGRCQNANCKNPDGSATILATLAQTEGGELQKDNSCIENTELEYEFLKTAPELKRWNLDGVANKATLTIAKTGHFLKRVQGVTGSCTEPGYPSHYHCTKCDKNYRSSDALTEIEVSETEPLGHLYGGSDDYVTFAWTREGTDAEATFECTRRGCTAATEGHFKTLTAKVGNEYVANEPECEGTKVDGHSYFAVSVAIEANTEGKYPEGFSEAGVYEGELELVKPYGTHQFLEDGTCKWKDHGCTATKATDIQVTFYGRNTEVLSTKSYKKPEGDAAVDIVVPVVPSYIGYDFTGWRLGETTYQNDQIAAAVSTAVKASTGVPVEVYATYAESTKKGKVRVIKKFDGTVEDDTIEFKEVPVGNYITEEVAKTVEKGDKTYTFSHWEKDGATIGTALKGSIRIQEGDQVTLCAVYLSEKVEVKPTITMTGINAVKDDVEKLLFTSNVVLPDGYALVENGMLYSVKEVTLDQMVWGSSVASKSVFGNSANNTMAIKIGTRVDNNVWVRGYLRYQDAEGAIVTIYTPLYKTTYNRASTGDFDTIDK